jgi:hypothetical protein
MWCNVARGKTLGTSLRPHLYQRQSSFKSFASRVHRAVQLASSCHRMAALFLHALDSDVETTIRRWILCCRQGMKNHRLAASKRITHNTAQVFSRLPLRSCGRSPPSGVIFAMVRLGLRGRALARCSGTPPMRLCLSMRACPACCSVLPCAPLRPCRRNFDTPARPRCVVYELLTTRVE